LVAIGTAHGLFEQATLDHAHHSGVAVSKVSSFGR
jgi:hypothetical protein